MAGTVSGGKAAALKNKELYGEDFYRAIGHAGGSKSRTGGFYVNRKLAAIAGAKGGRISRRYGHDANYKKEKERYSRRLAQAYKHLKAVHDKAVREREQEAKRIVLA